MTHNEFSEYHNYIIEFRYKGETKTGVIIDVIPYTEQKNRSEYLFIPIKNLLAWREAESRLDKDKMKLLSQVIDISKVTDARRINLGKPDIDRRVKDWKQRINEFYDNIKVWIADKPQYKINKKNDQPMYESMMKQFDSKSELLPSADIYLNNSLIMNIKPVGLWILGGNGRMDIISKNKNYTLIDLSDNFRSSKWYLYEASDKKNGKLFTKEIFLNLL